MRTYRWTSAVQAIAYLTIVASLLVRPVTPSPGHEATVFEVIAPAGLWITCFLAGALWTLLCAARMPNLLVSAHSSLLVLSMSYGVANLGTSLINDTGWQVFALCLVIATGHVLAIKRRPSDVS